MIMRMLSFSASMYEAIGPGLVLALALPFTAVALITVVRAALLRRKVAE
jgi:hypothetical protein